MIFQILLFLIFKRYVSFDALSGLEISVSIIGISYILFRQIHLLIEAPFLSQHPFSLVLYTAFTISPWSLIAGPIQRYDDFCQGLKGIGRPNDDATLKALHRSINGLIKAFVIAPLFLSTTDINLIADPNTSWLDFAIVFYSYPMYLYLNFSGYIDLMIGVASLCGFTTLPENFNRPYLARNVRDFWIRWHITLGVWIRQYVFTPLTTNLIKRSPLALHTTMMAVAVMVTFYLIGLWHGPTYNFIVFGLLQGVGVIFSATFEGVLRRLLGKDRLKLLSRNSLFHGASILLTFNFTCFTFLMLDNTLEEVTTSLKTFLF
jgi:D-alanyl-lipoteichoic acid acyltransferase DltB (MBOAT superfamily)